MILRTTTTMSGARLQWGRGSRTRARVWRLLGTRGRGGAPNPQEQSRRKKTLKRKMRMESLPRRGLQHKQGANAREDARRRLVNVARLAHTAHLSVGVQLTSAPTGRTRGRM